MGCFGESEATSARKVWCPQWEEIIRMLRELKGWTQKELSSRCGISPSNLSQLEHDRLDIGKRRAEHLWRDHDTADPVDPSRELP